MSDPIFGEVRDPLIKKVQYKLRRGTAARWLQVDPILGPSEPGHEIDTNKIKLGDGVSRWSELEYFAGDFGDGSSDAAVNAHINSSNPHPAYDDIPSLKLLFENGLI
jgi:hypothetical protein